MYLLRQKLIWLTQRNSSFGFSSEQTAAAIYGFKTDVSFVRQQRWMGGRAFKPTLRRGNGPSIQPISSSRFLQSGERITHYSDCAQLEWKISRTLVTRQKGEHPRKQSVGMGNGRRLHRCRNWWTGRIPYRRSPWSVVWRWVESGIGE